MKARVCLSGPLVAHVLKGTHQDRVVFNAALEHMRVRGRLKESERSEFMIQKFRFSSLSCFFLALVAVSPQAGYSQYASGIGFFCEGKCEVIGFATRSVISGYGVGSSYGEAQSDLAGDIDREVPPAVIGSSCQLTSVELVALIEFQDTHPDS